MDIDNPQTSASVSIHIEEDLVNIAQMGRKWFGDRFPQLIEKLSL